jgi:hypothetical protein
MLTRFLREAFAAILRKPDYSMPTKPAALRATTIQEDAERSDDPCADPACNCAGAPGLRYHPKPKAP